VVEATNLSTQERYTAAESTFANAILKTQFILWLPCFLAWLQAITPLFGKPSSVFHTTGSIQPGIGWSYLPHHERTIRVEHVATLVLQSSQACVFRGNCLSEHLYSGVSHRSFLTPVFSERVLNL